MPVTSVPFATVNSNDINGIRHALTDYTSITVDASAPGDFPGGAVVNDKLYQALGIFGAAIKGVANSMKDNKAANPDIPAGGNYGDYNFSGIFQPGVVTTIDPDNYKDTIYQWLSSSNAPFWMEVVEPSVKIGGVDGDYRGDFNYTPMSSGYGVADALQSERFGTNWAANVIYFMSKQYDGQVRVSGLSFINGGDSAFHRNHESGTSIDVSVMSFGMAGFPT